MAKIFYNKLVRDKVKEKLVSKTVAHEMRILTDKNEFQQELCKKVEEEAFELARVNSREAFLSEYADLMVVLDALTRELEFSEADIRLAMEESIAQKGLYREQLYLQWSDDTDYVSKNQGT